MCSSYTSNLISIDDLAIEESSKKRDPEKGALFSLFKTIGARFDLYLSVFKIQELLEMSETPAAKRARTSGQHSQNA